MSEFGTGYAYCLGLFLAHAERESSSAAMWLYGAADHICDMKIPRKLTGEKRDRAEAFIEEVVSKRLPFSNCNEATNEDKVRFLGLAKTLLLEWDEVCGIECERGKWE